MKSSFTKTEYLFAILSFALPFSLFVATSANTLMFDDSAEFATVVKLGSIAHPPGTPAYMMFAMTWEYLTSLLSMPTILSLTLFSGFCISLSSLFLFLTFRRILLTSKTIENSSLNTSLIALFSAVGFATAPTSWAWATNIEVYGFQCFIMSLALFSLVHYNIKRDFKNLFVAGVAVAMGLSNHHVTMIFFLPFVPFFFMPELFSSAPVETKAKKKSNIKTGIGIADYFNALADKKFWTLAGIALVFTVGFYGWMFIRAQQEYLFMFSKPDTLDTFFYHLRGGAYTKNLTGTSTSIMSARVPFFLKLTVIQIGFLLPFLLLGIYTLMKNKKGAIVFISVFYYLIVFIYQVNNNQWASTDAYMLSPFMILMIPAAFGIQTFFSKWKLAYVIPVILVASTAYHFPSHNRKTYPVGKNLMELLDKSAPKGSVVIISDWTTVMQYNYYRLVENFRPDLIVLNYDLKFTHYRILPLQYPEFYKSIEKEYTAFIDELRREHPYQVTSTGCDLTTVKLMSLFRQVVLKIESEAKANNRAFLTDPRAHVFYMTEKIYNPARYVSGAYMSSNAGDSASAELLLNMDFEFLSSALLQQDAGALDKLVDFQAMLDQHIASYKANNDLVRLARAEKAHAKVMRLQREMKKSMSFAYKIK